MVKKSKNNDKKREAIKTWNKEVWTKNPETGEETLQRQEFTTIVDKDRFVQTYIEGISSILQLDSKTDIRVLVALWNKAEWNTNKLILIKPVKEELAEELGYNSGQIISNSVRNLVNKGILIRDKRSIYYIDPNLFWKGTSQNRRDMIQVVWTLKTK